MRTGCARSRLYVPPSTSPECTLYVIAMMSSGLRTTRTKARSKLPNVASSGFPRSLSYSWPCSARIRTFRLNGWMSR
jgi:hypothetical protein